MKTLRSFTLLALSSLLLFACAPAAETAPAAPTVVPATAIPPTQISTEVPTDITTVDESGNTSIDPTALAESLAPLPATGLTAAESEALLYMREEEKLAHDVYVTLYEKWQLSVFQNISESEQTHADAVKTLIERYGLTDPAAGAAVGTFTNATLQSLYDQLVAQGSLSLADAIKVGAAIEEIDILDLEERMTQTDKADIILVYESLMKGSRNHLRSFTSTLQTQTGETYQPQYLSLEAYNDIVGTPMESGGQGKGNGSGKP